MRLEFTPERFELLAGDRVHIPDQRLSWGRRGVTDVWVERDARGAKFVRQSTVDGSVRPESHGGYADACFLLRERSTGRFFFMERATRTYLIQDDSFAGAATFAGDDALRIGRWLAGDARHRTPRREP